MLKVSNHAVFVLCVALVPVTESHCCQRAYVRSWQHVFSQLRPLLLLTFCDIMYIFNVCYRRLTTNFLCNTENSMSAYSSITVYIKRSVHRVSTHFVYVTRSFFFLTYLHIYLVYIILETWAKYSYF